MTLNTEGSLAPPPTLEVTSVAGLSEASVSTSSAPVTSETVPEEQRTFSGFHFNAPRKKLPVQFVPLQINGEDNSSSADFEELLTDEHSEPVPGRLMARPPWPRTQPSIPAMFYKDFNGPNALDVPFASFVVPAPVQHRPLETISSPFPHSCSRLCNHPVDTTQYREYKDMLKRARETWISDVKSLHPQTEDDHQQAELLLPSPANQSGPSPSIVTSTDVTVAIVPNPVTQGPEDDGDGETGIFIDPDPDVDLDDDDRKRLQQLEDADYDQEAEGEADVEDEDRIPEEQLLKYTNPDSPPATEREGFQKDYRVDAKATSQQQSEKISGPCSQDQKPQGETLKKEAPNGNQKSQIVLDLRKTSSDAYGARQDGLTPPVSPAGPQMASPTVRLKEADEENQPEAEENEGASKPARSRLSSKGSEDREASAGSKRSTKGSRKSSKHSSKSKSQTTARSETPDKSHCHDDPEITQVAASSRDGSPDITHLYSQNSPRKVDFGINLEDYGSQIASTPLERRALFSLEEQIKLEDKKGYSGKHDIKRLQETEDKLATAVRTSVVGRDCSKVEAEIAQLDKELAISNADEEGQDDEADFWLQLPRTFSSQSARFELPLNMNMLSDMNPVDYLSRFVAVSSARRLLYDKVFVRHRSLKDGLLTDTSTIVALEEVMGGSLSSEQQERLWTYLDIVLKPHIVTAFNYKQFSGIAAFVERIYCQEFNRSGQSSYSMTKRSEIEVADFDRLLSKLEFVSLSPALKDMLILIKESGSLSSSKW